jgi:hypothetical protein
MNIPIHPILKTSVVPVWILSLISLDTVSGDVISHHALYLKSIGFSIVLRDSWRVAEATAGLSKGYFESARMWRKESPFVQLGF